MLTLYGITFGIKKGNRPTAVLLLLSANPLASLASSATDRTTRVEATIWKFPSVVCIFLTAIIDTQNTMKFTWIMAFFTSILMTALSALHSTCTLMLLLFFQSTIRESPDHSQNDYHQLQKPRKLTTHTFSMVFTLQNKNAHVFCLRS